MYSLLPPQRHTAIATDNATKVSLKDRDMGGFQHQPRHTTTHVQYPDFASLPTDVQEYGLDLSEIQGPPNTRFWLGFKKVHNTATCLFI
jgi:hypothetical protein